MMKKGNKSNKDDKRDDSSSKNEYLSNWVSQLNNDPSKLIYCFYSPR
jgi:hypothetical protein